MLYDFICPECREVVEITTTMDRCNDKVTCPNCLIKMTRYYGNQRLNFDSTLFRKDRGEQDGNKR